MSSQIADGSGTDDLAETGFAGGSGDDSIDA